MIVQIGEYVSIQTLVNHQWVGPSVIAHFAPDSTDYKYRQVFLRSVLAVEQRSIECHLLQPKLYT